MKNNNIIWIILLLLTTTDFSIAKKDTNSTVSKEVLFSIDKKMYTKKEFPIEYQELSEEAQKRFVAKFLYYTIFLKSIEKEEKKYKAQIEASFIKKEKERKKKGIILDKLQKILFTKKTIIDTVANIKVLEKHKNIDSKIKDFYTKHKKEYNFPKRIETSHIVLKDINQSKEFIKKLEDNNSIEFFAKLAKEYSMDRKTKDDGGYVGDISEKQIGKEFFDAMWKTKEGAVVSKPLKQKDFYHILYVLKKFKAEQRTLEQERDSIREYLLKKEILIWKSNRYKKTKKDTKVEFYNIEL